MPRFEQTMINEIPRAGFSQAMLMGRPGYFLTELIAEKGVSAKDGFYGKNIIFTIKRKKLL